MPIIGNGNENLDSKFSKSCQLYSDRKCEIENDRKVYEMKIAHLNEICERSEKLLLADNITSIDSQLSNIEADWQETIVGLANIDSLINRYKKTHETLARKNCRI